ncbi:hypothetical protein PT974_07048 [Cladobotryum mycophilum]|uniref:Uncharacterized protein n=1 Tax=Cladobotryum mycophilum TaxID=491253 RepID=A0ABR0SNE0_9HYPO
MNDHQLDTILGNPGEQPTLPPAIRQLIENFLTNEEITQICQQFRQSCIPNRQVLWSGMLREFAQRWADRHGFQTLTTTMGPLMDTNNPECPRRQKSLNAWSKYVHGASILFAWHITEGDLVTVLSQPPPERFHPTGRSYYQMLEEPIVIGRLGNRSVERINVVHPTVAGAENYTYQMWPYDCPFFWKELFGENRANVHWREVRVGLLQDPNDLSV